jgi:hypothetical protein
MRSYTLSLILLGAAVLAASGVHAGERAQSGSVNTMVASESMFAAASTSGFRGDNVVSAMLNGSAVIGDTPRKFGPAAPRAAGSRAVAPVQAATLPAAIRPAAIRFDALLDSDGPRPYEPLLTGVVGFMLIAYQLRRKHRVLRPRPFSL